MGRIYKKIELENIRDLRKATRSILESCKDLSRGKKVKRILNVLNREDRPLITNTLTHNSNLLTTTIRSDNPTQVELQILEIISDILHSFINCRDGYYCTIPKGKIIAAIRAHSKVFSNSKLTGSNFEINNLEWQKTYLTAIEIWKNNAYK